MKHVDETVKVMVVPSRFVEAVEKLIKEATEREQKTKPIVRKFGITPKEFKEGGKIVREHGRLGILRNRFSDRLSYEYDRLEAMLDDYPRSKEDKKWLEKAIEKIECEIAFCDNYEP